MRRMVLATTAVFALILFAACGGGSSSTTPEDGGKGSVGITGEGDNTIEFSDDDGGGSVTIGGGEVPADFPDDIPLPDDYEITAAFSGSTGEGGLGANVSGVTAESVDDLRTTYEQALPDAGYTITSDSTSEVNGAEAVAITFEGNGIVGGKVAISTQDFSGENSDKNSLSVAYGAASP